MPEKKWVFDTIALSNFLLSDSTSILKLRYSKRAFLTSQVHDEISAGIFEHPRLKGIEELLRTRVFRLVRLSDVEHKQFLRLIVQLGKGEASTIAYARARNAIVVTDDRTARRRCTLMKVLFTGTIGILKAAVLDRQISAVQADSILLQMIRAGFYSPVRRITDIL